MAIIHAGASLTPSKLEMLSSYIDTLPQLTSLIDGELTLLGAYRFDDPAMQVGIETHLLQAGTGPVIHIPLTYRNEALDGAEAWSLGTMVHTVLGERWVYNGCGDPIYVSELVRTILTGGSQVDLVIETDDGPVIRPPNATVQGSGTPGSDVPAIDSMDAQFEGTDTVIRAGDIEVVVQNVVGPAAPAESPVLTGMWTGTESPATLAFIR